MKEKHRDENILLKPAEWLRTLTTTLDIQSAARHPASGRSTPWWAVQCRVGCFKPIVGRLNLRWVFRTQARRFQPTLGRFASHRVVRPPVALFTPMLGSSASRWGVSSLCWAFPTGAGLFRSRWSSYATSPYSHYVFSIISNVSSSSRSHEIGCAWLVKHLEDVANADDVILLYIDVFLIM